MPASPDPSAPERTAILVIRVWLEQDGPGRLRARLTQAADLADPPTTLATAADVAGVCAAVETWLGQLLDPSQW